MRLRVATWALLLIAPVCGLGGASYAQRVLASTRVDPYSLGFVIADAMLATVLLVLSGCAIIGVIVLRGVAEMLNQAIGATGQFEPTASSGNVPSSSRRDGERRG